MTRTSDDYTPAVQLWASGRQKPCSVQKARVATVQEAQRRLKSGAPFVYVRREDVEAIAAGEV